MNKRSAFISNVAIKLLQFIRSTAVKEFARSKHFSTPIKISKLAEYAQPIVSLGNQTGCLPNHVVGKGVIKEIRRQYPLANIVAIDYDPGASEVNQLNRIKLMLSTANKNMRKC